MDLVNVRTRIVIEAIGVIVFFSLLGRTQANVSNSNRFPSRDQESATKRREADNVDRIGRYLAHSDGRPNALAARLRMEIFGAAVVALQRSYRSHRIVELPPGWPATARRIRR